MCFVLRFHDASVTVPRPGVLDFVLLLHHPHQQREKEREDARHRNQAMEDRQRRTERHLEIEADISAHVDLLTASLHSQALQRQQLFHKVARSHLGPVGSNPPPLPPPTHTRAAVHTPSAAGASGVNTAHAGASGSTGTEPGPPPVPPPPTSEAGPAITAGTITQTGASTAPLAPHTPSPVPAMTTPATAAAPAAEAAAVAVSQRPPFKPMRIGEHRVTRRPWRQQPPRLASALSLRPPAVFLQDGQAEDKDQDKGKGKEKDSTGSGLGSATAGGEGGRDGHEAWSRRVEAWQAARTCGTIMGGRSCDTRDAAAQVKGASTSGAACGTDIPRTPAGGAPSTSASASASTPTLLVLAEWCYAWKDDEQVSVRATSSSAAHGASLKAWAGRAEQEEEAEGDGGEEEEEEEGCGGGGGVSQTRRDEKNSSSLLLGAALDTWPASGSSTEDVDVNEAALHKLRHQTAMALLTHGCGTRMTRVDVGALAANQLQDMLRLNPGACSPHCHNAALQLHRCRSLTSIAHSFADSARLCVFSGARACPCQDPASPCQCRCTHTIGAGCAVCCPTRGHTASCCLCKQCELCYGQCKCSQLCRRVREQGSQ